MHRFCFLTVVICLALAGQTRAVDLAKIASAKRGRNEFTPPACGVVLATVASTPAPSVAQSLSSTTRHHRAGPAPRTASTVVGPPPTAARSPAPTTSHLG